MVGVILLSFLPHREELLSHSQEHAALSITIVIGIVPFSFFMLRVFRGIERRIIQQNDDLSRRTAEMEALLKVGRAVAESLDLDRVLPAALEATLEATSAAAAEVWLLDAQEEAVYLRHHQGAAREAFFEISRFPLGEGYPGIVTQTGSAILVHDLTSDSRFRRERVKAEGFQTFHALPLRHTGGTIGVLAVAARNPKAFSGDDELRLLQLMADHIATAVQNAQLHEEVQTLAILTERDRLAREMHDGLGQVLGYVSIKAQAVKELLRSGQADTAVEHL